MNMPLDACLRAIVFVSAAFLGACTSVPPLVWPDLAPPSAQFYTLPTPPTFLFAKPSFVYVDPARTLIDTRIESGTDVLDSQPLHGKLLKIVDVSHQPVVEKLRGSGLEVDSELSRIALLDEANAIVVFKVNEYSGGRQPISRNSTHLYALVKAVGEWKVVRVYQWGDSRGGNAMVVH